MIYFSLSSMAFLKSFIGSFTALTSLVLLGGFSPALAGKDYELKIDRFEGSKIAAYQSNVECSPSLLGPRCDKVQECFLTKRKQTIEWPGIQLIGCYFYHVGVDQKIDELENITALSLLLSTTSNDSWQILSNKRDEAPAIITYLNESIIRARFPLDIDGDVWSGGIVYEAARIDLTSIKHEILNIKQIEIKVSPHEYLWKPDPVLIQKALNFEEP